MRREGYERIAGADEAGAGPLAGPLVAAAVILPRGARLPGVDDGKLLSPQAREHWARRIREVALDWSVIEIGVAEVDGLGPYRASIEAMTRAVRALDPAPDFLLVDARRLPIDDIPQRAEVRGDSRHLAIAAAGILAKVHRDARMVALDALYPEYGFARHKGYSTPEHLDALARHGACPLHRRRWAPVRRIVSGLFPPR